MGKIVVRVINVLCYLFTDMYARHQVEETPGAVAQVAKAKKRRKEATSCVAFLSCLSVQHVL